MIEELSLTFAVVYGLVIKALQQAFITHQRVDFSLAKLTPSPSRKSGVSIAACSALVISAYNWALNPKDL
jgi:hypothetical protein